MHNPQPPRSDPSILGLTRDQPKCLDDFQPILTLARFKDSQLWIHLQSFERPRAPTTVSIIATSAQVLSSRLPDTCHFTVAQRAPHFERDWLDGLAIKDRSQDFRRSIALLLIGMPIATTWGWLLTMPRP